MSKDQLWAFDEKELHEDDARYAYVIPSDVTTSSLGKSPTPQKQSGGYGSWQSNNYGGSYGFGGGGSMTGYTRHQHDGKAAFNVGRVFIGGGSDSGIHADEADVLVDLTAGKWVHKVESSGVWSGDFGALNDYIEKECEYIGMDWPDGSAPPMPIGFFKEIVDACTAKAEREDRDINLVFACMGGHGRTGSALAAVLIACKGYTAAKAIEYVREHHCTKACETSVQMAWLCKAAGQGETQKDAGFPLHSYSNEYGGKSAGGDKSKSKSKSKSKKATTKTATKTAAKGGQTKK
jgi:protein-tyrosine phosphatase